MPGPDGAQARTLSHADSAAIRPVAAALRTLLSMPCDGIGPSQTCTELVTAMRGLDYPVDLFATRAAQPAPHIRTILPGPFARLPHSFVGRRAVAALEQEYLRSVTADEIAWLWPSVSVETHRELARRGVPIVLEAINTRMATARSILDAAYDGLGLPAGHGITEARIAEEEEKLSLAQAIFCPSPMSEAALAGTPLDGRQIATSYGAHPVVPRSAAPRPAAPRTAAPVAAPFLYLFVGTVCVRKGAHLLLGAWAKARPKGARLRLLGKIEPAIAERFADVLNRDDVETPGFDADPGAHYRAADVFVFPSLEEGGPLVTYEAAMHGLPILATPAGAGRFGADTGACQIVTPAVEPLADAMATLHTDAGLREGLARQAAAVASHYSWGKVAARRVAALTALRITGSLQGRGA